MSAPRRRAPIDRVAQRYFLYVLSDAKGEVLYVGRSADVAARLRNHYYEASNPDTTQSLPKALWLMDVRRVDMAGPFTWDEAVTRERHLIEQEQPPGNVVHTRRLKAVIEKRSRPLKAAS